VYFRTFSHYTMDPMTILIILVASSVALGVAGLTVSITVHIIDGHRVQQANYANGKRGITVPLENITAAEFFSRLHNLYALYLLSGGKKRGTIIKTINVQMESVNETFITYVPKKNFTFRRKVGGVSRIFDAKLSKTGRDVVAVTIQSRIDIFTDKTSKIALQNEVEAITRELLIAVDFDVLKRQN